MAGAETVAGRRRHRRRADRWPDQRAVNGLERRPKSAGDRCYVTAEAGYRLKRPLSRRRRPRRRRSGRRRRRLKNSNASVLRQRWKLSQSA